MGIDAALGSALSGIKNGMASAANHATQVATAFSAGGSGDMAEGLIGLSLDSHQVKANAKVIKVVNDTIGSVVDLLA